MIIIIEIAGESKNLCKHRWESEVGEGVQESKEKDKKGSGSREERRGLERRGAGQANLLSEPS